MNPVTPRIALLLLSPPCLCLPLVKYVGLWFSSACVTVGFARIVRQMEGDLALAQHLPSVFKGPCLALVVTSWTLAQIL